VCFLVPIPKFTPFVGCSSLFKSNFLSKSQYDSQNRQKKMLKVNRNRFQSHYDYDPEC
jgi:hypothetical protein